MPRRVRYYNPKDFNILSVIGSGGFASVHAAHWKNTQSMYAVKKYTNVSTKEIINEVFLMKMAEHPNVIKFYGVTKFEDEKNYSLILEYADSGTLKECLKNNATIFGWESQLKFAKEISSALLCLHENEIVHRDLHSDNILIHQSTIKLADFGNSCLQGSKCTKAYGVIPYVDPKILESRQSYISNAKSDIYSLGVLFWELTSCRPPFNFKETDDQHIALDIINGKREEPVPYTDGKFVELYQRCWQYKTDNRPDIRQVISELNKIDSGNNNVSTNSTNFNSEENGIVEVSESEDFEHFSDCNLLTLQLSL